jgi:Helitron helicase-like domain at N-terminus/Herpesvirus tegument protein, N-terminal conserved region
VSDLGELETFTDTPPSKDAVLQRKRRSDQLRNQSMDHSSRRNSSHGSTPATNSSTNGLQMDTDQIIEKIRQKFEKKVFHYLTEVCIVCNMRLYDHKNHRVKRSNPVIIDKYEQVLKTADPFFVSNQPEWILCHRCDNHLSVGKIPCKGIVNKMYLPPVPEEMKCLSSAEVRLISQVRAYIKIYLLSNGRGQKANKGMVVHFPTEVSHVIKQLPLTTAEADIIVVKENCDGEQVSPAVEVDRNKIFRALNWLVRNNPLYKDVQIMEDAEPQQIPSITISRSQSIQNSVYEQHEGDRGYKNIGNDMSILHASFSQGNLQLFGSNSGTKCTAMSASFIAHCHVQSPDLWTKQTLDGVLISGNDFYSQRKLALNHNHAYLSVDEIAAPITVFERAEVDLSLDNSTQAIQFVGYANKCTLRDLQRLDEVLKRFLESGYRNGLLTIGIYSMAFHVHDGYVYYFDSHGRGEKGGKTRAREGTACVIKIPINSAHRKICAKANSNCISPTVSGLAVERLRFTLTVINPVRQNDSDTQPEYSHQLSSPTASPARKSQKVEQNDYGPESSSEEELDQPEVENPAPSSLPIFGALAEGDCVVDNDDPVAPEIDAVLQEYELDRPRLPPINSQYEDQLDLLAFPQLYPHGINGLHANRDSPFVSITPLDYYQQRFMSADNRFVGASEALFSALSACDKHRIKQKIAVCCEQTRQGQSNGRDPALRDLTQEELLGVRNPHVYMSGIRGSGAYWRQYSGDLIAMVKALGTPTLFMTISYDDLNSEDSINALCKVKFGKTHPNVKPLDIPFLTRKKMLNDDPVTAARHFSMRLSALLGILKDDAKSIFGHELLDYSARVEFQSRGSPHSHMLIWLKDVPELSSTEGIRFIEKNVSCSLNNKYRDLVLRYQNHSHTKTCYKNKNSSCRFGFEKPQSDHTKILNDHEIVRNKGRFFEIKRSKEEGMIGFYHPILLPVLKSNMDIQVVTSAVGVAYYVAKYCSKGKQCN